MGQRRPVKNTAPKQPQPNQTMNNIYNFNHVNVSSKDGIKVQAVLSEFKNSQSDNPNEKYTVSTSQVNSHGYSPPKKQNYKFVSKRMLPE